MIKTIVIVILCLSIFPLRAERFQPREERVKKIILKVCENIEEIHQLLEKIENNQEKSLDIIERLEELAQYFSEKEENPRFIQE